MKKRSMMIATAAAALLLCGGAATIEASTAYASTEPTSTETNPTPSPTPPPASPWEPPVEVYVVDSDGKRLTDSSGNHLTVDSQMALPTEAPSDVSGALLTGKVSVVVDEDGVVSEGQEVEDRSGQ